MPTSQWSPAVISATIFHRNLGLAGGSLWLIEVGTAFAIWALFIIHSTFAAAMLALVAIAGLALLIHGIRLILRVRRLPRGPVEDPSLHRRIWRRFGIIFVAEAIACGAVVAACLSTQHWKWIVPLQLIVVGLHFLPLARLFQVPRYNLLGAVFCVIPITTLLAIRSSAHIGHAVSWTAIPAIGCGLASLATGWAGLMEIRGFLDNSRTPSPVRA